MVHVNCNIDLVSLYFVVIAFRFGVYVIVSNIIDLLYLCLSRSRSRSFTVDGEYSAELFAIHNNYMKFSIDQVCSANDLCGND